MVNFLLIFLINFIPFVYNNELYSKCTLHNGNEGECIQYENCASAKLLIKNGILPQLCGIEYVCCQKRQAPVTDGPLEILEESINSKSNNLMSKVLESTNCYSGKIYKALESHGQNEAFTYETTDETKGSGLNNIRFMAKIGVRNNSGDVHFYCGGFLLTSSFVVMPAHCADYKGKAPEIVQLGIEKNDQIADESFEKIPIAEIHMHPNYTNDFMYDDIALLELVIPSSFLPACIWRWQDLDVNQNASTFALGHDLNNAEHLQVMSVDIFAISYCNDLYQHMKVLPKGIEENQYCVGRSNISDAMACKGFVGAPLFAKTSDNEFFVVGLANFVRQCFSKIYPMIFTNILKYKKWLESVI